MNNYLKRAFCLFFVLSLPAYASDSNFFAGGGVVVTATEGCSSCERSGFAFEFGSTLNDVLELEVKYLDADRNFYSSARSWYGGANIGYHLGTKRVRLYGKLGGARITETAGNDSSTESNLALGFGFRLIPGDIQKGAYIKLETYGTTFGDDNIGVAYIGIGTTF